MRDSTYKCCLCGKTKTGWGNDPWPLTSDLSGERCCDSCNLHRVIPARLQRLREAERKVRDCETCPLNNNAEWTERDCPNREECEGDQEWETPQ